MASATTQPARASGSNVLSGLERGIEGTNALAFAAGSLVQLRMTAADLASSIAHPSVTTGAHNASAIAIANIANFQPTAAHVQAALAKIVSDIAGAGEALSTHVTSTGARHSAAQISAAQAGSLAAGLLQDVLSVIAQRLDSAANQAQAAANAASAADGRAGTALTAAAGAQTSANIANTGVQAAAQAAAEAEARARSMFREILCSNRDADNLGQVVDPAGRIFVGIAPEVQNLNDGWRCTLRVLFRQPPFDPTQGGGG